jgi:ATP-dependent RNA helicase DeaD
MRPSPEPLPEARPVEMTMMPVWLGVGQREKITPEEVITCIQGHTGLPSSVVGGIEIHEEHTLVDVTGEHARGVVLKLKHGLCRGKPLREKLANR